MLAGPRYSCASLGKSWGDVGADVRVCLVALFNIHAFFLCREITFCLHGLLAHPVDLIDHGGTQTGS